MPLGLSEEGDSTGNRAGSLRLCLAHAVGLWAGSGNSTGLISRPGGPEEAQHNPGAARLSRAPHQQRRMAPEEQGKLIKSHLCRLPHSQPFHCMAAPVSLGTSSELYESLARLARCAKGHPCYIQLGLFLKDVRLGRKKLKFHGCNLCCVT